MLAVLGLGLSHGSVYNTCRQTFSLRALYLGMLDAHIYGLQNHGKAYLTPTWLPVAGSKQGL